MIYYLKDIIFNIYNPYLFIDTSCTYLFLKIVSMYDNYNYHKIIYISS